MSLLMIENHLISGSQDSSVKVWDTANSYNLATTINLSPNEVLNFKCKLMYYYYFYRKLRNLGSVMMQQDKKCWLWDYQTMILREVEKLNYLELLKVDFKGEESFILIKQL